MASNNLYLGIAIALSAGAALLYVSNANASENPSSGDSEMGRGIANNNPMNLRYITPARAFNGQTGQDSGGYGVYDTTANGVRAGGKQLDIDYAAGLTTIAAIIAGSSAHGGWAPSSENNTPAYIADVSQRTGIPADQQLAWPGDKLDIVAAIIWHEEGSNPYDQATLQEWINS